MQQSTDKCQLKNCVNYSCCSLEQIKDGYVIVCYRERNNIEPTDFDTTEITLSPDITAIQTEKRNRRGEKMTAIKQVEISVEIVRETKPGIPDEGAYLMSDGLTEAWIPKAVVSDYSETKGVIETIFIPEWLAMEKGLL